MYFAVNSVVATTGNIDTAVKTLQWDKAPAFSEISEISAGDEAVSQLYHTL